MTLDPYLVRGIQQATSGHDSSMIAAMADEAEVGVVTEVPVVIGSPLFSALVLAGNLLSRIFPRVAFAVRGDADALLETVQQLNPNVSVRDGVPSGPYFAIGSSKAKPVVTVGGDDWSVAVGRECPVSFNVFAGGVMSCIGVAQVFRRVFKLGEEAPPDEWSWSLVSHEIGGGMGASQVAPFRRRLGNTCLVGAGAIGHGLAWALRAAEVSGAITIIDSQTIDETNVLRYTLARSDDVGISKPEILRRELPNLDVQPIFADLGEVGEQIGNAEVVLSAIDSPHGRLALQALLPKGILNAWTQPPDLGVSAHFSFGDSPCLACLYWPKEPVADYFMRVAGALGIEPLRALAYLVTKTPVGQPLDVNKLTGMPSRMERPPGWEKWAEESLFQSLVDEGKVQKEDSADLGGHQISSFYREAICGGALLRSDHDQPFQEIPMPHQSALAGILLGSALVAGSESWNEIRLDVNSRLPSRLSLPRQRTPGCLCSDSDFLDHYATKWSAISCS